MSEIKPKDLNTKYKVGEYAYVRSHKVISPEFSIHRIKIDEIVLTVKETMVDIHYDGGGELWPEIKISSTIQEAEGLALAELAAHKLAGKDKIKVPKKKFKRKKKKGMKDPVKYSVDDLDDDDDF